MPGRFGSGRSRRIELATSGPLDVEVPAYCAVSALVLLAVVSRTGNRLRPDVPA